MNFNPGEGTSDDSVGQTHQRKQTASHAEVTIKPEHEIKEEQIDNTEMVEMPRASMEIETDTDDQSNIEDDFDCVKEKIENEKEEEKEERVQIADSNIANPSVVLAASALKGSPPMPNTAENANEFEWNNWFEPDIEEMAKSLAEPANLFYVFQNKTKTKFEALSKSLNEVTADRDRLAAEAQLASVVHAGEIFAIKNELANEKQRATLMAEAVEVLRHTHAAKIAEMEKELLSRLNSDHEAQCERIR